ncbi:adenine nucleotide alpha hydrolases-like protein [Hypoxylon argillaceum]|nr:adenine nucleotide alpha hydrolases-like protein [Hypoxylon argillaceum]
MSTLSQVFHTGARPIAVHEFVEAVRAICPPRFPTTTSNIPRPVALAVSGGVDSMALAYLCSRLKMHDPEFQIADNPVSSFRAIIVDHRLREESRQEAISVARALRELGLVADVQQIAWGKALGPLYDHPKDLPNFESVARRLRYRKLGARCGHVGIASMFFAHHEDDQYETVLMRLLQGHGVRGLRGMKAASEIPECEGLHRARQSGYVDDQKTPNPYYNSRVPKRQYNALKRELRSSIDRHMHEEERREYILDGIDDYDFGEQHATKGAILVELGNIDVEDGGVTVYRPLLAFSKKRLIATCEANNIPWWEDHTNQDQTLTMRNAVRHMYKNYTLPVALQKPSILALSRRCEQKAQALEAEANRLLSQTIIYDFEPNVGTASVQFPEYDVSRFPRDVSSPFRRRARILRQREVAGLLIRRIIGLVTPEEQEVPLANLQNVISRLFPALSDTTDDRATPDGPPKAFVIAGVHFVPIEASRKKNVSSQCAGGSLSWYLSRTPYPAHLPIPRYRTPYWSARYAWRVFREEAEPKWSRWLPWALWDGRFWIRARHCLPYRVILQPFLREHAKAFRELLPPEDRDRLAALLKHYAPGKTRYTLPALYLEEDLDLARPRPRWYYPLPPSIVAHDYMHTATAAEADDGIAANIDPASNHPRVPDVSKMKLIALPSLDVQIPGLDAWFEYEIRYRRIDRATLQTAGSFGRGSFVSPRAGRKSFSTTTTTTVPRRRRGRRRRKIGGG